MVANIRGYTPNYSFRLINFDTPRWHTNEYANWTMLDSLLLQQGAPQSRGYWTNSTTYNAGDRAFDIDSGSMYRCLIEHTSAPTGSFAEDRAARPTLWTFQIIAVPVYRGEWVPEANYINGDIVLVDEFSYYLCTQQHTAGLDFDADSENWQLVFSTGDAVDTIEDNADAAAASAAAADASSDSAEAYANSAAISAASANVDKIEWKGIWFAGTAYNPNDAIEYQGTSYIAKTANVDKPPNTNPLDWDLLAKRGADGPAGGGGGDMLRAQNLADVQDPVVSLANIGGVSKSYVDTQNTAQDDAVATSISDIQADISGLETDISDVTTSVNNRVLKTGDTMGGALILPATAPTDPNQAVTKNYVDNNSSSVTISVDPPATPKVGSLWWESDSGNLYIYYNDGDSSQWVIATSIPDVGAYIAKSGDTMTGQLKLVTPPIAANDATSKAYVDTGDSGSVRWDAAQFISATSQQQARSNIYAAPFDAMAYSGMQVNGSMDVSQDHGTAAVASGYIVDGWAMSRVGSMVVACAQGASTSPPGIYNQIYQTVSTAQTSLGASDASSFYQPIEGFRVMRLAWGTAYAQPITIGFWTAHHRTGTYSVAVRNKAQDRTCIAQYTQNAPDIFEYKTVTIPGDTGGVWATDNTVGIYLVFCIAAGSSRTTATIGSWVAGSFDAGTGQVNAVAATSDAFRLTGVVVLPGTQAPTAAQSPFVMRPYDQELVLCQRYWEKNTNYATPANTSGYSPGMIVSGPNAVATCVHHVRFSVRKRATPTTVTTYAYSGTAGRVTDMNDNSEVNANIDFVGETGFRVYATIPHPNGMGFQFSADARL